MKIFDISRELTTAPLHGGDTPPKIRRVLSMEMGDDYNLSDLTTSLHAGTHIDAPLHYFDRGADVARLDPEIFCGVCDVITFDGEITGEDVFVKVPRDCQRLIMRTNGRGRLTEYALMDLVDRGLKLIGIDDTSIASSGVSDKVHKELLSNGTAIIEGLDLTGAPDGKYFIVCVPIKIKGAEGAPCRAILLKDIMIY